MKTQTRYIFALLGVWAITSIPFLYYVHMQIGENRIVESYITRNALSQLPINKESAVIVSDLIRRDFNTEESTFVTMRMPERPFLREDAGLLLTNKEGLCGEGTRVLVNILDRLGFDATRITLYNRNLRSLHTLVSVVSDGQEFLVDSINSSERFNTLVREHNISSRDFNLVRYSGSIKKRRKLAEENRNSKMSEVWTPFASRYWLYSYEATPYSKILAKLGLNAQVFNFQRPHRFLSVLAEKPNTVTAIVWFVLSLCIVYLLHRFAIIRKLLGDRPRSIVEQREPDHNIDPGPNSLGGLL